MSSIRAKFHRFFHPCSLRDERGAVSPMIVILIPTLVGLAGLTFDGGTMFAARREANNVAAAAARAGADVVTEDSLYLGLPELAPEAAGVATQFAMTAGMASARATALDGHIVEVHVSTSVEPVFLGILGIGSVSIDGTAKARVQSGVTVDG